MSVKKYAGEEAVERLSEYIKRKLESVTVMPSNPIDGTKVIYLGDTNDYFTQGDIYKWNTENDEWIKITYSVPEIDELLGDTIQVDELPTASADELGNIYEFVGTTTANYINGRFYRCVSDGASTPTYSWEEVDLGDGTPHWSGTRAEYEAIKNTLEAGTIVNITDDYDDGLEVVDVVEEDNMNPVTSNAVAEAISQIKTETKARYKFLSFNSIPGVTFAKRDNNPKALSATRVDNIIVLNYSITIQGTYTGTSNWLPIFNASQLDSLLDDDEILNDTVTPYFCSGITYTNNASYNKLDGVMNGYYLYFYNSAVFDMGIQGQIILGVQKTP